MREQSDLAGRSGRIKDPDRWGTLRGQARGMVLQRGFTLEEAANALDCSTRRVDSWVRSARGVAIADTTKLRVVRMVSEGFRSPQEAAQDMGLSTELVRSWVARAERDPSWVTQAAGSSTSWVAHGEQSPRPSTEAGQSRGAGSGWAVVQTINAKPWVWLILVGLIVLFSSGAIYSSGAEEYESEVRVEELTGLLSGGRYGDTEVDEPTEMMFGTIGMVVGGILVLAGIIIGVAISSATAARSAGGIGARRSDPSGPDTDYRADLPKVSKDAVSPRPRPSSETPRIPPPSPPRPEEATSSPRPRPDSEASRIPRPSSPKAEESSPSPATPNDDTDAPRLLAGLVTITVLLFIVVVVLAIDIVIGGL